MPADSHDAPREVPLSVDVEASGPAPSRYSLLAIDPARADGELERGGLAAKNDRSLLSGLLTGMQQAPGEDGLAETTLVLASTPSCGRLSRSLSGRHRPGAPGQRVSRR
jgi:hypothetical protein